MTEDIIEEFNQAEKRNSTIDAIPMQTVHADRDGIIESLRTNRPFLIEFFIGEELEFPVPQIHVDILNQMCSLEVIKMMLAIPRGHAKTTMAKIAVIWYFLFTRYRFCVYLSNSSPIAKNACRDIIKMLQSPNFVSVFGKLHIVKESETEGIWIFDIEVAPGKMKRCILRAAGANQQMRGINVDNQRPDIAVVDDLEDLENTGSPVLQKKLDHWVFGTFLKALAHRHKVIWIGNMLQPTSLLARLSKHESWHPTVYGCLVKDKVTNQLVPLWPDLWPVEKIIEDMKFYKSMGLLETWMCEMMNMPGRGQNGFGQDQINYIPRPNPDDLIGSFLTIDPAFGQDVKENDCSAIAAHGITEDNPPCVVDVTSGHFREHELFQECLKLAIYWNAWVWGIEAQSGQSALLTLFKVLAVQQNIEGIEFIPLSPEARKKSMRISTWVSSMEAGTSAIHEEDIDITTQLLSYDITVKDQTDDIIDACAYQIDMVERFFGLILYSFQSSNGMWDKNAKTAKYGSEVYDD